MVTEIVVFSVVSTVCTITGLIMKRKKLTQETIVTILFCGYGVASASTVLTIYALSLISGVVYSIDNTSLATSTFFAMQFMLVSSIFTFLSKIRKRHVRRRSVR